MKAGAILPHTRLYGGVKRFVELGRAFQQKGYAMTLYTPDGVPPNWTCNDIRVATFCDLEQEDNDMLFITDRKYKEVLMRARARYKIFYHVSLHHKARTMVRDKKLHVFACSTNVVQYDRFFHRITPFLAAGAVDTRLFCPAEEKRTKEDVFTILVYGRISERVKGTELVVRACERLHRRYPEIRMILFDTPVNPAMSKAIEDFSTHVPFDFITNHPVEENAALFHQADIFVAAERGAGWANTVAEAMACGIPVVATRSGTADILIDGETGILVKRNKVSIARGIRQLIESPELRQKLAVNGRRHIEQFDWQILADRIIGWYEEQEKK
jgi:glycosyltransferase involved in cell wall biosynthesis